VTFAVLPVVVALIALIQVCAQAGLTDAYEDGEKQGNAKRMLEAVAAGRSKTTQQSKPMWLGLVGGTHHR
jgi:hypothetical protein